MTENSHGPLSANVPDTVNATGEGYPIENVAGVEATLAELGYGGLEIFRTPKSKKWKNKIGKFHKEHKVGFVGRQFYAYAEGTRKPIAAGLGFALGPRNSVVVLTLPLLELCVGFSEKDYDALV
jgi:hypothetical protein